MDSNSIDIAPATAHDLPGLCGIMNHAITQTMAVWYEQPKSMNDVEQWWLAKQAGDWPVLVARQNQQVLGYATYGPFRPFDGYRFTVEHSVYVDPSAHRRGIGQAMLAKLIDRARQQGRHVMVGGIDAVNQASLALHQKLGFIEVARMPEVGFKFQTWRTLIFVQKFLADPPQSP